MTPEIRQIHLKKFAPIIYGRYWKTDVAKHLQFNYRSITNWVNGACEVPREIILLLAVYARHGYRYNRKTNKCEYKRNAKRY